jgi:TATA-box binding protein (TBP) (component of TFIID and TFIIIB)
MNKYISESLLDTTKLRPTINIDVMSATCNIGTKFILENIHEHIDLSADCIISSQYKNKLRYIQLIDGKKYKKAFSNQITLIVKITSVKYLNVKLFVNGSLQITGGEKIEDYNILFDKILSKLRMQKSIVVDDKIIEKPLIIEKPFLEDIEKVAINGFKINMINSGCKNEFMINRDNLYSILLSKEKLSVTYEPMTHAGVSIPYLVNNVKKASIFVFESGRLIITGVKTVEDINGAHDYIIALLSKWKKDIIKKESKSIDDIIMMLKQEKGLVNVPAYKGKPRGRKKKPVNTTPVQQPIESVPVTQII